VFGEEDLRGLSDIAAGYESTLKKAGIPLATPLGILGAVVPPALDVTGFGIGEKSIARGASVATKIGERTPQVIDTIPKGVSRTISDSVPLGDRLMMSENLNREGRRQFMQENPGLEYDSGRFRKVKLPVKEEANVRLPVQDLSEATPVKVKLPQAKGTTPAKAAVDINKKAVAEGFTTIPKKELASYTPITKVKTLGDIEKALTDDFEALHTAVREGNVPAHLKAQPTLNAVAQRLKAEGRWDEYQALAKSPIAAERSALAQELGSAGFNSENNDPLQAIQHIQKLREKAVGEAAPKSMAIKKNLEGGLRRASAAPTKSRLASFIDEITC
jgi:hypothetical protein